MSEVILKGLKKVYDNKVSMRYSKKLFVHYVRNRSFLFVQLHEKCVKMCENHVLTYGHRRQ